MIPYECIVASLNLPKIRDSEELIILVGHFHPRPFERNAAFATPAVAWKSCTGVWELRDLSGCADLSMQKTEIGKRIQLPESDRRFLLRSETSFLSNRSRIRNGKARWPRHRSRSRRAEGVRERPTGRSAETKGLPRRPRRGEGSAAQGGSRSSGGLCSPSCSRPRGFPSPDTAGGRRRACRRRGSAPRSRGRRAPGLPRRKWTPPSPAKPKMATIRKKKESNSRRSIDRSNLISFGIFTWQMSQRGSLGARQSSRSLWCLLASLLAAWTSTSQSLQSAASSAQHITVAGAFSHTSHWIFIAGAFRLQKQEMRSERERDYVEIKTCDPIGCNVDQQLGRWKKTKIEPLF